MGTPSARVITSSLLPVDRDSPLVNWHACVETIRLFTLQRNDGWAVIHRVSRYKKYHSYTIEFFGQGNLNGI